VSSRRSWRLAIGILDIDPQIARVVVALAHRASGRLLGGPRGSARLLVAEDDHRLIHPDHIVALLTPHCPVHPASRREVLHLQTRSSWIVG